MFRVVVITGALVAAACGGDDGSAIGTSFVCLPNVGQPGLGGGPRLVDNVVGRGDEVIAIDYETQRPFIYEADLEIWRDITTAPTARYWTVGRDNSLLVLNDTALYKSTDAKTFDVIGPGSPYALSVYALGNLGAQDNGAYFAQSQQQGLLRWSPGETTWTPVFDVVRPTVEQIYMTNDGTIWGAVNEEGNKALVRVRADGSAAERVFDCATPELLYCSASLKNLAINAKGDVFYYLRNDIMGIHRFFQVDAKTLVAKERGRLEPPYEYATYIAAIGDTLYITARQDYEGGQSDLLVLGSGETTPHKVATVQSPSSAMVTTRDGSHLYAHSPGVCELR